MKSKMLLCFLSLFMAAAGASANERIYVNREVTTHIVMPENIKMVDISTTKIAGNQCTDNIVRSKTVLWKRLHTGGRLQGQRATGHADAYR